MYLNKVLDISLTDSKYSVKCLGIGTDILELWVVFEVTSSS